MLNKMPGRALDYGPDDWRPSTPLPTLELMADPGAAQAQLKDESDE
jgi:hypothetical protein